MNIATADSPIGVGSFARSALLAMAKESIPPTPANYRLYYDKIAGVKTTEDSDGPSLQELQTRLGGSAAPRLAEWKEAIDLVLAQRDWGVIEDLILKSLKDEGAPPLDAKDNCNLCQKVRSLNGILYVMESFARNLDSLFPNNPVISGQIEIVRDLLENPEDKDKLFSAKRALTKAMSTSPVQAQLSEAKKFAQDLSNAFLAGMGEAGANAGMFCDTIEKHKEAIEKASSQEELMRASKAMLSGANQAHALIKESQARMETTHAESLNANERIENLENELKLASEKAKQDYLTGLLNRRGMDEELDRAFDSAITKISVALLDIDNFKKFNDTLGHEAGDLALKGLADTIQECVLGKGVPARMGGEEFVIIFTGYDAEQVKEEMERLQRTLTKKFFMYNDSRMVVTFSAGVAQRLEGETPADAISRADDAMYQAKNKGKNRVEISWG